MKTHHTALSLRGMLLAITVLCSTALSAELKSGDSVTLPELEDQFEAKQSLNESTKWLLFSYDMDGTKIIREALEGQTDESLTSKGIQVYADISGMPGFVARFIALPKLKKLPYPIVLSREEEELASIPREEEKATVVQIEQGKVKATSIVSSVKELKALIAL